MSGWGTGRVAARLLCAAAAASICAVPSVAQPAPPANPDPAGELDPNAPLAPLPELGVEWPDLNARDELEAPEGSTPQSAAPTADEEGGQIRYAWTIDGLAGVSGSEALLKSFREQSSLEADRKHPANAAQIGRRSRSDAELLTELLRSRGYYDAAVTARTEDGTGTLRVILTAGPGALYKFASVELPGIEAAGPDAAKLREAFAVKAGDPVVAQNVIDAGTALTHALGEEGFATAKVGEQSIVVNHETHLATLVLPVEPGPVARFGTISVSGEPPFGARHVGVIARFRPGDRFERSEVDDLRRALIATTLVSTADVQLVPIDDGRTVNIAVRLEPAPSHTIAGELGYSTGQGARVEASWTDRNFINPEGAFTVRGVLGTSEQLFGLQFRRSNFRRRDQTLNLTASASHQDFDAYEARTIQLAANIDRQSNFIWQKKWTWSYGTELLATDEQGAFSNDGAVQTRSFLIAALPLALGYDGSDNLLDPTRGFRLAGRLSPELSMHNGSFTYARTQFDASAYHPVSERVVAAGRIRLGTIIGAGVYDIAPSRRFYSGGGGSVRGYGYQQLGPKDEDGDPSGGRGLAEFGLEARIRLPQFGGNIGVVPFLDGGTLTTKAMPDFSHWRFAAGLGVRYYSSFGPIRVDVGVPLNREKGDSIVAVTVALGQAF